MGRRPEQAGDTEGCFPGAQDLAVEVSSPSDPHAQFTQKALRWLVAGCLKVLVADPKRRTISAYRSRDDARAPTGGDAIDGTGGLPG